jgi:hypothetical protein
MSTKPAQSSLPPKVELRGFNGRILRLPPLALGAGFSLSRVLYICAVLAVATFPAFIVRARGLGPSAQTAAVAWFVVWAVSAGQAATLLLRHLKFRYVAPRFSITMFRRFHNKWLSLLCRGRIAPVLGCYGEVSVVADDSLAITGLDPDESNFEPLVIGDPHMAMTLSDDEWRSSVLALMSLSDLVVIDLSLATANVVWEMASALQFLPPHRIFIIGVSRGLRQEFLDAVRADDLATACFLESQPWMSYRGWLFATSRFRVKIFRALRAIECLDGEVIEHGTWQPLAPPRKGEE